MNKEQYFKDLKFAEDEVHELEFKMRLKHPRIGELLKLKYVVDKLIAERYMKYGIE